MRKMPPDIARPDLTQMGITCDSINTNGPSLLSYWSWGVSHRSGAKKGLSNMQAPPSCHFASDLASTTLVSNAQSVQVIPPTSPTKYSPLLFYDSFGNFEGRMGLGQGFPSLHKASFTSELRLSRIPSIRGIAVRDPGLGQSCHQTHSLASR